MDLPKFKEPPLPDPWIPADEEVKRIISAAGNSGDMGSSSRNKVIVELLFFGGIRIGELISINLEDIRSTGIRIRSEKGEAERIIGLPTEVMNEIREYIEYYRYNSDPAALFTTRRGGRMSYHYVRNILGRIGARAGVPRFHAHAARHRCATALLRGIFGQKPLDIRMVQIHLGHRSLRTTERYTHITQEEVAEQVRERLTQFFQFDEKVIQMHESLHAPHGGAARI
ncbi:tyrosine-type recombinase/integrase [Thermogymnomonas acidicola]|uniref:tyrosine-type recombinase/integrase n=1 Tax=Thermogymnomonas acidicola TaxID=399579 RepID=UPI0009468429|nr:tyrosine-type recombinase/integrase [Thermogymnomonas acidicola]